MVLVLQLGSVLADVVLLTCVLRSCLIKLVLEMRFVLLLVQIELLLLACVG